MGLTTQNTIQNNQRGKSLVTQIILYPLIILYLDLSNTKSTTKKINSNDYLHVLSSIIFF